jgi:hypothetical protein
MAAFPYVIWRAIRAVLPNAPSKISVPFINSAPGKNCLVPSPFVCEPDRRFHAAKSNNKKKHQTKSLELRGFAAHLVSDHPDRSYNSNATRGVKNFPD